MSKKSKRANRIGRAKQGEVNAEFVTGCVHDSDTKHEAASSRIIVWSLALNKQICSSQVDAARQIRDAGFQSASLRQAAAVIAAVGREISREVGQGMRIRF